MTGIPSDVTIGPHRYWIDTRPDTAALLRDEDARGDSRPDQLLVRLDTGLPHSAVAETLLHELLHCCWSQSALRALPVAEAQEEVVTALTPLLLDLVRRNSALVDFLAMEG